MKNTVQREIELCDVCDKLSLAYQNLEELKNEYKRWNADFESRVTETENEIKRLLAERKKGD